MKVKTKNKIFKLIVFMVTYLIHSLSFASMPGDIDSNGKLELKDCLQILHNLAYPSEDISINIVQAKPIISGTYSQIRNSEKTTYTFNEDGSCVRVGPDDTGVLLTSEGTWHYENESLYINTIGEVSSMFGKFQVNIDENYQVAFTNEDASKLIMAAPGKSMENMPDITGRYTGGGEVHVIVPAVTYQNKDITIESIIDVDLDGSWESVVTMTTFTQFTGETSEIETSQGKVDPSLPTIYVFGSYFFPDVFSAENEATYFNRE